MSGHMTTHFFCFIAYITESWEPFLMRGEKIGSNDSILDRFYLNL